MTEHLNKINRRAKIIKGRDFLLMDKGGSNKRPLLIKNKKMKGLFKEARVLSIQEAKNELKVVVTVLFIDKRGEEMLARLKMHPAVVGWSKEKLEEYLLEWWNREGHKEYGRLLVASISQALREENK